MRHFGGNGTSEHTRPARDVHSLVARHYPGSIDENLQKISDRRSHYGGERFSLAGKLILNLSGMRALSF
jgi:hypothetical protein